MAISARKFCLWIRLFCHIALTLLFLQKKAEARGFHRCLCFVHFTALPRLFSTPCTVPVEPAFCRVWDTAHQTSPAISRTQRHPAGRQLPHCGDLSPIRSSASASPSAFHTGGIPLYSERKSSPSLEQKSINSSKCKICFVFPEIVISS